MSVQKLRWFGTDGIWGVAFEGLFAPSILTRIGCAFADYLHKKLSKNFGKKSRKDSQKSLWVLMGMDTRDSGSEFLFALAAGLEEGRVGIGNLGVCSSGALAWLTRYYGADFGIMVSASHNTSLYYGIKFFDSKGSFGRRVRD